MRARALRAPLRDVASGRMCELPPDPDLDALPDELVAAEGPLHIRAVDPETGETFEQSITREELGAAFADRRRLDESP